MELRKMEIKNKIIVSLVNRFLGEDMGDLVYLLIEKRYKEAREIVDFLERR